MQVRGNVHAGLTSEGQRALAWGWACMLRMVVTGLAHASRFTRTYTCVLLTRSVYARLPQIFREMHRVLKPGGTAYMSFSNRCFPTKAIALWTATGDGEPRGRGGEQIRSVA